MAEIFEQTGEELAESDIEGSAIGNISITVLPSYISQEGPAIVQVNTIVIVAPTTSITVRVTGHIEESPELLLVIARELTLAALTRLRRGEITVERST